MKMRFLFVALTFLAPLSFANAASNCIDRAKQLNWEGGHYSKESKVWVVDQTLHISGEITPSTLEQYNNIDLRKIKNVDLNSEGGDIDIGKKIADDIYDNNWNTQLSQYSYCWSICTGMFQSGQKRSANAQSLLGYHNAHIKFKGDGPLANAAGAVASKVATHLGIDYLEKRGLSKDLSKDILATSSYSMHCITPTEAVKYKAATAIVQQHGNLIDGLEAPPGQQVLVPGTRQ